MLSYTIRYYNLVCWRTSLHIAGTGGSRSIISIINIIIIIVIIVIIISSSSNIIIDIIVVILSLFYYCGSPWGPEVVVVVDVEAGADLLEDQRGVVDEARRLHLLCLVDVVVLLLAYAFACCCVVSVCLMSL